MSLPIKGEFWSSRFIAAIGSQADIEGFATALTACWYKDKRLLTSLPETCAVNLTILARLLDVPVLNCVRMALRYPSLFYQKPETQYGRCVRTAHALSITPALYIKMAQNSPNILGRNPQKVGKLLRDYASLLDVPDAKIKSLITKKPSLLTQKPGYCRSTHHRGGART